MSTGRDEADDLFAEAMGKVRRLPEPDKVPAKKRPPRARDVTGLRSREAIVVPVTASVALQATDQPWWLVADGVSRERLKRLTAGCPPVSRTFDLHGMTRDAALDVLGEGFATAISEGARVLCVIHGRGLHSPDGNPVLKQAVYHWLSEGLFSGHVLAAVPQPGSGGGACLVLLRRRGS